MKAGDGMVFTVFTYPQIHTNMRISVSAKTLFREMNSFLGKSEIRKRQSDLKKFKKFKNPSPQKKIGLEAGSPKTE